MNLVKYSKFSSKKVQQKSYTHVFLTSFPMTNMGSVKSNFRHYNTVDKSKESEQQGAVNTPQLKIAVVLSGCGHLDASDVWETISLAVHLSRKDASVSYFAPTSEIDETIQYNTKLPDTGEERWPHIEATRMTREKTRDLKTLKHSEYSALFFPGGEGSLKTLCNFSNRDSTDELVVESDVDRVIKEFHTNKKPIGLIGHSVMLAVFSLGETKKQNNSKVTVTLGNDENYPDVVRSHGGAVNKVATATSVLVDDANLVVTTGGSFGNPTAGVHIIFEAVGGVVEQIYQLAAKAN